MPRPIRTRLYREFLTPALHRRFTRAAGVTLVSCYLQAIAIGYTPSLFWAWFPLGKAGIRTLLLFICPLLVFVLRVALLHGGRRSTISPFHTFTQHCMRFDTLEIFFCYVTSAWWFSEVYIWSVPRGANLNWIIQGRSWEPQRLNERPIYLRSLYFILAFWETARHIYLDYDQIRISAPSWQPLSPTENAIVQTSPWQTLKSKTLDVLKEIGLTSLVMSIFGPVIYSITIRKCAWNASLFLAAFFQWDVLRTERLSYIPPYHFTIILRSLFSSFCLLLLWRGSNIIFAEFTIQEPLKRGEPLTKESNDPNGSLINGLKSRKSLVKTFAFWELVLISRRFEERRVSIFRDIEREGGSAWSQVLAECLKMIDGVFFRIKEFEHPFEERKQSLKPEDLQSLPRIGTPLKQEAVFLKSPPHASRLEAVEANVGSVVKSYGDNQFAGYGDPLGPRSRKAFEIAKKKLLTPEQQEIINPSRMRSYFNDYLMLFVRSPLGMPFRQTFSRRISLIALGKPYSEFVMVVDAIESLTCLTKASLKEDVYGGVSKTVPLIVRAFLRTHQALERLVKGLAVHWTDVGFTEEDRWSEDIRIILDALRYGLTELVEGFGSFKAELGLHEEEMQLAKAIVTIPKNFKT